jgi:DNA-binding NarL/FixJ family response regulator
VPPGDAANRSPVLRILLVDDHELFRRGVRDVLDEQQDMRVVADAADAQEALALVRELWPSQLDLVLMDIDLPRLDGIAATRIIRAEYPDLPVVMLTVSASNDDLYAAAHAGSVGFLRKSLTPDALVRALRDYQRSGALPMSRAMAARLLAHYQEQTRLADQDTGAYADRVPDQAAGSDQSHGPPALAAPPASGPSRALGPDPHEAIPPGLLELTRREREILALVAQGWRDREIADRLTLAEVTVKTHVQNILRKLGARNRGEAAARFRRDAP